jgi:hypothetical protein
LAAALGCGAGGSSVGTDSAGAAGNQDCQGAQGKEAKSNGKQIISATTRHGYRAGSFLKGKRAVNDRLKGGKNIFSGEQGSLMVNGKIQKLKVRIEQKKANGSGEYHKKDGQMSYFVYNIM